LSLDPLDLAGEDYAPARRGRDVSVVDLEGHGLM
jgi:hypothetical protein